MLYFLRFSFVLTIASSTGMVSGMDRAGTSASEMQKFIVISEYATAALFYPEIRSTKLRFHNEPDLDADTRLKICRDIISSDFFTMWGYYPYEKATHPVMRLVPVPGTDTNYIKKVDVSVYGTDETFREYGFVCPAQKRSWDRPVEFFVSEAYNVSGKQHDSDSFEDDSYIAARFVFRPADEKMYLYLMAEQTAKAELSSQSEIELRYLKIRKENHPALVLSEDPLCKLDVFEKIRICLSVFNSAYFHEEDGFVRTEIDGACEKHTVSFLTEEGKETATAAEQQFQEWVMRCTHREDANYLLSRAYKRDEILVYLWDKDKNEMNLKTLVSKVRFENL